MSYCETQEKDEKEKKGSHLRKKKKKKKTVFWQLDFFQFPFYYVLNHKKFILFLDFLLFRLLFSNIKCNDHENMIGEGSSGDSMTEELAAIY